MPNKQISQDDVTLYGMKIKVDIDFWTENRSKEQKGFYLNLTPYAEDGTLIVSRFVSSLIVPCARYSKSKEVEAIDLVRKYGTEHHLFVKLLMNMRDNLDPTGTTWIYSQDPGHGWLSVPRWLIVKLGFQPSKCSYIAFDHTAAYLEEDEDMPKFIQAFTRLYGCPPKIKSVSYNHKSFIRDCPAYPQP